MVGLERKCLQRTEIETIDPNPTLREANRRILQLKIPH